MQRSPASSERTPLVQPTYVFETSLSRSYQKRLRKFQCAICVSLLGVLAVALLVTISFDLSRSAEPTDNGTEAPIPETPVPAGNLTMVQLNPALEPMLQLKWPLEGKPPSPWVGAIPSPTDIASAVTKGNEALTARKKIESLRKPLEPNSPANRAQKASATAATVKPLADAAYIGEEATRILVNGTYTTKRKGGVGVGPSTNGSFFEPPYCRPKAPPCPPSKYRSVTGACNNLRNPLKWGVANTPFRRVLPADYGDGISSPRAGAQGAGLPSARDVSVTVHRASYARDSEFTVMLAVWGQFIDHDITSTALSKGENSSSLSCCDSSQPAHPECFPVKLDPEDPYYEDYNVTCMEFVRSAPAPTCYFGPREQLNQATAFLDGSVVYGFSKKLAQGLRTHVDGQLRMMKVGSRELLPQSLNPHDGCNTAAMMAKGRYCFESGDDRANENLHLTTMHLIWARQHNRLATQLKELNPGWDDETLYQEARKVVGAQMQHITYTEFLPHVLGEDVMWALNLTTTSESSSESYNASVDPSIANHFSAAAFRFAHTLLPGLIHNVDSAKGSLTYTRLHDILFNPYDLYGPQGTKYAVKSALDTPIHSADPHVTSELSNHLFEPPARNSSSDDNSTSRIPGVNTCGLDLVSLNIQRGRDHGLPSYPAWRELCGFPRPKTFDDLTEVFDNSSFSRISQIYSNVDDIDLYTGSLAEQPHGRLLGPTLTCLISDQFLRLKVGDRFWYENRDPVTGFSSEQLSEIRKTTLAGVICANEQLLDQIQPMVMVEASSTNPLVDCMELPQPDLAPWSQATASR